MKERFPCSDEHTQRRYSKEQILLGKMYEVQDLMFELLGEDDFHFRLMEDISLRLEIYLQNQQDML